ncbi:hypothetical protein [Saccharothrix stipae]
MIGIRGVRALTLAVAVASVLGPLAAAPAMARATAQVANCNGHTVVSADYVTTTSGSELGAVQLCRNDDSYFAMYINYGPLPAGRTANAWLYRYLDGAPAGQWNCDSPGGNGHVAPGQTWCVTPQILAPSSRVTFIAKGTVYSGGVAIAQGWTRECNRYICY